MRSHRILPFVCLALVATLTGCSTDEAGTPAAVSPKPTITADPTVEAAPVPTISDPSITGDSADQGADFGAESDTPEAIWDEPMSADQWTNSTAAATGFVAAFIRKDITSPEWEAGYLAALSGQAKTAYEDVDQDRVPGTGLTDAVTVQPGATNRSAIVEVPTDAGVYEVQMMRHATGWQVMRAILPTGGTR